MARILISSIGTGDEENNSYKLANYEIGGKIYREEKFIAKALCEHLKIDKLFLVGTRGSMWRAVFEDFGGDHETSLKILKAKENNNLAEFIPSIEEIIDKKLGTKGSKCFIIEYGVNEEELWGNFGKFYEIFREHMEPATDEIHLDITHSFRSLSLMSFVMSEFTSNSLGKELDIRGVYYGMLECASKDKEIPFEKKIAPIVNLAMFFKLLRWSKAIRELKTYGNAKEILLLLKQDEGKVTKFENFTSALSMSDIMSLKSATANLKTEISFFKDSKNEIYKHISSDLEEFIEMLDVESLSLLQYRMAEWYYKSQNYALSYVMLAEAIVSAVAEDNRLDVNKNYSNVKGKKGEYGSDKAKNILKKKRKDELSKIYNKVSRIRNNIAHARYNSNRQGTSISSAQHAVGNLPLYIGKVKSLFENKK